MNVGTYIVVSVEQLVSYMICLYRLTRDSMFSFNVECLASRLSIEWMEFISPLYGRRTNVECFTNSQNCFCICSAQFILHILKFISHISSLCDALLIAATGSPLAVGRLLL